MSTLPAVWRQSQPEDCEFEVNLGYVVTSALPGLGNKTVSQKKKKGKKEK
jgi:hypothetical protein